MNKIFFLLLFSVSVATAFAQNETFDLTTYTPPKGWKKKVTGDIIQFSTEDGTKDSYCLISLYKAVPGTASTKENFDLAWTSLVKEIVKVSSAPEMLAVSTTESGWETQTGYAPFDNDGNKGVVMLATATASGKMVNMIILTNSGDYEKEMGDFIGSISLKKNDNPPVKQTSATNNPLPAATTAKPVTGSGFAFTTTNFDDGWTSVAKEDWVEVTKGNIKVLLHYPTDGIKAANTDVDVMCSAAWNYLVAPRYSNIQGYRITPGVLDYERPYYAEATLTDNATGSKVFVVLFKKATGWMEFIAPDKNTFIKTFGLDISKVDYYSDSEIWNKMKQMANYNKFAIAASDFTGKWNDRFSANTYYTNIYTGLSAGMSTYSSSQSFEFSGNSYKWSLVAANSRGGASQFASAKGAGTFKVLNNWQIYFSEMEGKPKTFHAYFSCVKGGRILWMNDVTYKDVSYTGFAKE